MSAIILGVLPIFVLIAIGWGLRAGKFIPAENWPPIEKLAYFVFYPGFLLPAAWSADFHNHSAGAVSLATTLSVVIVAVATLLARPILKVPGPTYTSIFQGVLRWNSFVFLPLITTLFGVKGAGLSAIVMGSLIPTLNVMCVVVMARWGHEQGGTAKHALIGLARNPVIWACGIGLLLNVAGVPEPEIAAHTLKLLADAALAMGLVVAGGGLSFRYALSRPWIIGAVSLVKLILMPILMWGLCKLLGGDHLAQGIALACGSAPGAAASYVLARQMGGDAPLMAGVVAFTTAASLITIPVLMILFGFGHGG